MKSTLAHAWDGPLAFEVPIYNDKGVTIRRADAVLSVGDLPVAVEFQVSPLSVESWARRTRDLTAAGYAVLWVWDISRLKNKGKHEVRLPQEIAAHYSKIAGPLLVHAKGKFYSVRLLPATTRYSAKFGTSTPTTLARAVAVPAAGWNFDVLDIPDPNHAPEAWELSSWGLAHPPAARLVRIRGQHDDVLVARAQAALDQPTSVETASLHAVVAAADTTPGVSAQQLPSSWCYTDQPEALELAQRQAEAASVERRHVEAEIAWHRTNHADLRMKRTRAQRETRAARKNLADARVAFAQLENRLVVELLAAEANEAWAETFLDPDVYPLPPEDCSSGSPEREEVDWGIPAPCVGLWVDEDCDLTGHLRGKRGYRFGLSESARQVSHLVVRREAAWCAQSVHALVVLPEWMRPLLRDSELTRLRSATDDLLRSLSLELLSFTVAFNFKPRRWPARPNAEDPSPYDFRSQQEADDPLARVPTDTSPLWGGVTELIERLRPDADDSGSDLHP